MLFPNQKNKLISKKINLYNTNIYFISNKVNLIENYSSKNKYINIKTLYVPYVISNKLDSNLKSYSYFTYSIKRIIDFSISIPLLILSSPLILYSAYKIKKESPEASIFFKQKRVGKDGKKFTCYKLRSMRTNTDYFNKYTQKDDPRIFPWGNFMRKTRIDELPQLWNVIKGDMHLIGPRAEWDELVENYEKEIPHYNLRHLVKPGITGWAQVNYQYGANLEDTKQKLMYDLYYIKNWSLWLEIKTIFKTIMVIFDKKGM